jgi:FkbM family methyltransferase
MHEAARDKDSPAMPLPEPFTLGIADLDQPRPPPAERRGPERQDLASPRRDGAAERHEPAPPRRQAAPDRRDDARTAELEHAMAAAPEDRALRTSYFDHLTRLASSRIGLITVMLPELGAPLYLRCGTPDISGLAQAYRDDQYDWEMRATPQRILVIGAHAGYAAVELARRHPRAQLLCAEPLADNFRMLSLNTGAWRRIRVAPTALWHSATRLAPAGRLQSDWLVRLTDEALDGDRTIPAISVGELLGRAGWSHVDMIVCDACGSEREIFCDPLAPWLRRVDAVLVRGYEQLAQGGMAAVAACLPEDLFDRRPQGAMELFLRRIPLTAMAAQPRELPLIPAEPATVPFQLHDVAGFAWAFFVFDGSSCQLHPNVPGGAPAHAIFPVQLAGHTRFTSGVAHAGQHPAAAVVFQAQVQREDGTIVGQGETTLAARGTGRLNVALSERLHGPARVVLQTEMTTGAPHNQMAWARWIEPRLS